MTVKLVVLKSGEDVIADLQEMMSDDKVIGYFLKFPCKVGLYGEKNDVEGNKKTPFQLQLTPWIPLTNDEVIPIPADWVVTIVEPVEKLKEMYLKGLKNYENRKSKADSSDEQSDSSESD